MQKNQHIFFAFGLYLWGRCRSSFVKEVVEKARHFSYPVYLTSLEFALEPEFSPDLLTRCVKEGDDDEYSYRPPEKSLTLRLKEVLDGTPEVTAREALFKHLRRRVLVGAARALGASKVFTGESSETVAINLMSGECCWRFFITGIAAILLHIAHARISPLISGLATGRGMNLPLDTSYLDERDRQGEVSEVTFVRVMRDFSRKEVAFYSKLTGLPAASVPPTFSAGQDTLCSVDRLTEDFVVRLQEGFPATVPTVLRTGAKLEPPSRVTTSCCALCAGARESDAASGAMDAAAFSREVSRRGAEKFASQDEDEMIKSLSLSDDKVWLNRDLCYSCKTNCSKMQKPDSLTGAL